MAFFASLRARAGTANSTASSTSQIPEAIQLHTHLRIDFLNGATVVALPSSTTTSTDAGAAANAVDIGGIDSSQNAPFSLLSYQALQTQRQDDEYTPSNANNNINAHIGERQKRRHHDGSGRPDLGIWDCRIVNEDDNVKSSSPISLAAMLLRRVVLNNDRFKLSGGRSNNHGNPEEKKDEGTYRVEGQQHGSDGNIQLHKQTIHSPPIIMVIDMSELSEIQQRVERMKAVVVKVYENDDTNANGGDDDIVLDDHGNGKSHTTSLSALKKYTFGAAAMINDPSPTSPSPPPSPEDKRIALILAVILPPSNTTSSPMNTAEEYKERRARDLVLYHLHKFSLEVDCTLCFVRREGEGGDLVKVDEGGEGGSVEDATVSKSLPSISIDECSKVIRRVAMGLSPVEVGTVTRIEEENNDDVEATKEDIPSYNIDRQHTPSIYAPGTHDAELINGVYLRNASCDGSWDAVTDDLNVALPSRSSNGQRSASVLGEKGTRSGNGDEEWLSKLAQSMGISSDAVSSYASADASSTTPTAGHPEKVPKISTKKRITRASSSSTRDKDAKPKDQKEVMNFFSNLVKK